VTVNLWHWSLVFGLWSLALGLYYPSSHHAEQPLMDLTIITLNFVYAVLGVVLMFIAYRVIDKMTPEVNFPEELRKGNIAVAIFVAAIFVSVALVVAGALN
jgi:uncharacterized membrane protein YjfL (UPF0719 family)